MKKILLLSILLLGLAVPSQAGRFVAIGLNNPHEVWYYFDTMGMTVSVENSGPLSQVEIQTRARMVCSSWQCPTNQPFQVKIPFELPKGAVLISAGLFDGTQWIDAKPTDLFKAEEIYEQTPKSDLRLLLRKVIQRDYYGKSVSKYEMRLSPIYRDKDFTFRVKYVIRATPGIWQMRTAIPLSSFFESCPTYHCSIPVNFYFVDHDFPSAQPKIIYGIYSEANFPFEKVGGKWKTSIPARKINFYSNIGIRWFRPLSKGPELRIFENESGAYYSLMLTPPLLPTERNPRHILIIYDLAENIPSKFSRTQLLNEFKVMAISGLTELDSINVLLTDFVPKTLREHFVPATDQTVEQLFNEITQAPQPYLSTLPQLLRAAKDYFNRENVAGEIWLFSSANKHSKPLSVANEIIDLSLRQIKPAVSFRIFNCANYDWEYYIWINNKAYFGNDYLYENLARLSHGGVVKARDLNSWQLRDALADVFFPALDVVEVDALPQGGFHESRFLLNSGRTHFPIAWPYVEIGRYQGNRPFSIDYFGKIDGHLYKHTVTITDTFNSPHPELLATMWHGLHVEDLLKEPQSQATIEEIGQIATKYHFLSPYNGFVIPGPSGLVGFKRLVEVDTTQSQKAVAENQPTRFDLAAFPNPFNLSTEVQLTFPMLKKTEKARISIYNLLGKRVRTFQFELPSGSTRLQFRWNGESTEGLILPSGIYVIVGKIGTFQQRLKVTLLK
ncbi:MAG: T9SS type A sorting domain-containing protein [Calditrichaeota bacterium]|nr:T9SS type A sorting domain-containing protein [Calditrichota bacterium]